MKISLNFTSIHVCSWAPTQHLWLEVEEERVSTKHTQEKCCCTFLNAAAALVLLLCSTKQNTHTHSTLKYVGVANRTTFYITIVAYIYIEVTSEGWLLYSLRPKISDVFDFQTSCLTIRLIQKFYVNYKINKLLLKYI